MSGGCKRRRVLCVCVCVRRGAGACGDTPPLHTPQHILGVYMTAKPGTKYHVIGLEKKKKLHVTKVARDLLRRTARRGGPAPLPSAPTPGPRPVAVP
eukprot:3225954-Rhodomonas_salina.1